MRLIKEKTVRATEQPAPTSRSYRARWLTTREMAIFAMLATVMLCGKLLMEWAPNIHPLAMLVVAYTVVYRKKALIPIYLWVALNGVVAGFNVWWVPYLYIWLPLWGVSMLLPRRMSRRVAVPVYMLVCGLHGALFGILYAPAQALFFGLDYKAAVAWVITGTPFDVLHAVGNLFAGLLVLPISELLARLEKQSSPHRKSPRTGEEKEAKDE